MIARKMANAFFPDAKARIPMGDFGLTRNVMGGLWVGGDATLTEHALTFAPNAMNRVVHQNPDELVARLPLSEIEAVEERSGLVTNIIEVRTNGRTLAIRCYGAGEFAAKIRRQAGLA